MTCGIRKDGTPVCLLLDRERCSVESTCPVLCPTAWLCRQWLMQRCMFRREWICSSGLRFCVLWSLLLRLLCLCPKVSRFGRLNMRESVFHRMKFSILWPSWYDLKMTAWTFRPFPTSWLSCQMSKRRWNLIAEKGRFWERGLSGLLQLYFFRCWIRKELHRVFPNFDFPVITTGDDFGRVGIEENVINGTFMSDKLEGPDLWFEIPDFYNTVGASGYDLFPLIVWCSTFIWRNQRQWQCFNVLWNIWLRMDLQRLLWFWYGLWLIPFSVYI